MSLSDGYVIRLATLEDCVHLPEIEREAAKAFVGRREMGASNIDLSEVTPLEYLLGRVEAELLWVVTHRETAAGFLAAAWHEDDFYIAEVNVHPSHAGKALGRSLIETAVAFGFAEGADRITLSTFMEIPWNRPYYEQLGFRVVPEAEWTAFMQDSMRRQKAQGLDILMRCFMARDDAHSSSE